MSRAIDITAIDETAQHLMAHETIIGLALAIINDGKPEHVAAYRWRNVEQNLPLTINTR